MKIQHQRWWELSWEENLSVQPLAKNCSQWRRVIGHLQVIAKMTSSSCQADLGWDCSNCYRFTSFSWFIPPIPKYVNSTLIYLERSLHSQSIIIGHFSCRWKSYDWSDSVQVGDVKKRRKQSFKGRPILHCLESISLVAEEATIREYCWWYITNRFFPYFTSLFKRNQTTKTFEVVK